MWGFYPVGGGYCGVRRVKQCCASLGVMWLPRACSSVKAYLMIVEGQGQWDSYVPRWPSSQLNSQGK